MMIHYNLPLVALSCAIAVLASYSTLRVALRAHQMSARRFRYWLIGGSFSLGLGIWSMHFVGMLAHVSPVPLGYDPALTLISIGPAVGATVVTLSLFRCRANKFSVIAIGGLAIGVGIASMHYIGMAALKMSPPLQYDPTLYILSWITAIATAIVGLGLGLRTRENVQHSEARKFGAAIVLACAIVAMHYIGMAAAEFSPESVSMPLLADGLDKPSLEIAVWLGGIALLIVTVLLLVLDARLAAAHAVQSTLNHLALHDQLTGLPNRALFHEQLANAIHRARRHQTLLAVLAIDLDGFREINNQFGHPTGDVLLRDVAQRLRRSVRQEDLVARLSGDEFIALAAEAGSPEQVAQIAQRLLDELDQADGASGIAMQGSIGISLFPQDGDTAEALLKHADFALYRAKAAGKKCFHFYDSSVEDAVEARQQRLKALQLAVALDELVVHYQPQVNVKTGSVVGVEALVRWQHPEEGVLSPAAFIPLAEEVRMMPLIDAWVIRRACLDAMAWQEALGTQIRLAVNISAQSIDHTLVAVVREALHASGLAADSLELEITETSLLVAGEGSASGVLQELSALGVHTSIDDFGTGYGSLVYLNSLPIQVIKLDRQFIQASPTSKHAAAIVRSLTGLAEALEIRVVAEGVETIEQLESLHRNGCEVAQGYWFSPPLTALALKDFVQASAPQSALSKAQLTVEPGQTTRKSNVSDCR